MCFYKNKKKHYPPKELEAKDFINFLKKAPNLVSVYFPGWEPLMKKDFFKITDFLLERDIPMLLLTNGTLITNKNFPNLLYNKNNIIMLSLDGDRDLHNKIREASFAYDKVVQSIRLLKNKCDLRIVCVISEENLDSLWKTPKIINELGFNKLTFEYERKYSKKDIETSSKIMNEKAGFSDLKMSRSNKPRYSFIELKKSITKMEREAEKYGVEVGYLPTYFKEEMHNIYHRTLREKYECTCQYLNKTRIDPEGNYIHCFAFRKSFGNILKSPLEEIWHSSKYRNFRKTLLKNNLMPVCETCWGVIPIDSKLDFSFK